MTTKKLHNTLSTDEELYQLSSAGDGIAFELLYERYFNKLVWFAGGFTKDKAKAEDIVQEVFIKIIKSSNLFDPSKKFSTWIYTVTGNQSRNFIRDEQNRLRLVRDNFPHEITEGTCDHRYDSQVLQKHLNTAITQLNEKERQIYILRFEQELSIKEIAAIISIPEGSVKSGIFHLLKKISRHLKEFTHAIR